MLTTSFSRCTPVVLLLAYFVAPSSTLAWRFRNACRDAKMPYSIRWDSLWHCNDTIRLVVGCHVLSIFVYWYVCSCYTRRLLLTIWPAGLSLEDRRQRKCVLQLLESCRQRTGWSYSFGEDLKLRWEVSGGYDP